LFVYFCLIVDDYAILIINNSTNISKTNNHRSPLLTEHTKKWGTMTYDVENPGPGLGQTQTCGRVKPDFGIPTLSS
jgi:hypothetical protein